MKYGEIVNVSNSLRRYYGLSTYHDTDPETDQWLETNQYRCIVTVLIDAMGSSILSRHLRENSFFRTHTVKNISTVYPPTTSAATTSFRTGKMPVETGWLGWNQYMHELDDNLILFRNMSQYPPVKEYPGYSYKALPVTFLEDELNTMHIPADSVWPSWGISHPSGTISEFFDNIASAACQPEMRYVYAYWDVLDTFMHRNGPDSAASGSMLKEIEQEASSWYQNLPEDIGVLFIADHSQVRVKSDNILRHEKLADTFRVLPGLEPRSLALYIKDGRHEEFKEEFMRIYGDSFRLYTHEEVVRLKLFGEGVTHPRFEEFIGDYLAVASGNIQIVLNDKITPGDHAGGLEEEAVIPLILL